MPTTSGGYSTTRVAGLPASNGPSGPRPGVTDTSLPVAGGNGSDADRLGANAVSDIQDYWKQAFPQAFDGKPFDPVKQLVSYDSAVPGPPVCNQNPQGLVNAFYCPVDDSIAWDRGQLLPKLNSGFGPLAVVTVLAHEMGHATERRAGTVKPGDPTIVSEQQSDCFTGAFFRYVAEGRAQHFQVSTGDGLNQVMGLLSFVKDTPGTTGFTDPGAHGSAFDRVTAFQFGFTDGPKRCAQMDLKDITQRTTQYRFWKPQQEQHLPVSRETVAAVSQSLNDVFRDTGARPPAITASPAACPDVRSTSPASYCPSTNTVSLDLAALKTIGQPPGSGPQGVSYGDFAAFSQVASRYVLSVQKAAGMPLDDETAGLRTACLVGAWSGSLLEDPSGQRKPVGALRLAPDDLDQAVAELLDDHGLIAANVDGVQAPAGFARLEAFRTGFQDGITSCTAKYSD